MIPSSPLQTNSLQQLYFGFSVKDDLRVQLVPIKMLNPLFWAHAYLPITLERRKARYYNKSFCVSLKVMQLCWDFTSHNGSSCTRQVGKRKSSSMGKTKEAERDWGSGLKDGKGWRVPSICRLKEVKEFLKSLDQTEIRQLDGGQVKTYFQVLISQHGNWRVIHQRWKMDRYRNTCSVWKIFMLLTFKPTKHEKWCLGNFSSIKTIECKQK